MPGAMHRLLKKIAPKDDLKILVIKYGPLGEVILTSPLIRTLKENLPQSRLFLLCDPPSYSIYSHNPYVDKIIFWDGHRYKRRGIKGKVAYLGYLRSLKSWGFALVVDAYGGTRSATWTLLSGARVRVGYKKKALGPFYNIRAEHNFSQYHCECVLDLARAMGLEITSHLPEIYTSAEDEAKCEGFLSSRGLKGTGELLIGINPGASHRFKRWASERFAKLADLLLKEYPAKVLLIVGPGEEPIAQAVRENMESDVELVSVTNFREWAAFIRQFDLFITNDSSPLHISACVRETPTVAIFTSTANLRYLPPGEHYRGMQPRVNCNGVCFVAGTECDQELQGRERCLDLMTVNEVFRTARELLEKYCYAP